MIARFLGWLLGLDGALGAIGRTEVSRGGERLLDDALQSRS